jgi:hypothetical protein
VGASRTGGVAPASSRRSRTTPEQDLAWDEWSQLLAPWRVRFHPPALDQACLGWHTGAFWACMPGRAAPTLTCASHHHTLPAGPGVARAAGPGPPAGACGHAAPAALCRQPPEAWAVRREFAADRG